MLEEHVGEIPCGFKSRPGHKYGGKMVHVKKVGEVYRCEVCGNVVKVVEAGGGELVCCGKPMTLLKDVEVD
jgi:desulfoferrodoxin-like iron-binding protein